MSPTTYVAAAKQIKNKESYREVAANSAVSEHDQSIILFLPKSAYIEN